MTATWMLAGASCAATAVLETVCAGKAPLETLRALRQPRWSPPMTVWIALGLFWYGICFVGLVRLLPHYGAEPVPVLLLWALMIANAAWNLLLFRLRRFGWSVMYLAIYAVAAAMFVWLASGIDRLTAILFIAYLVYLPYAGAWTFRLWRLNGR